MFDGTWIFIRAAHARVDASMGATMEGRNTLGTALLALAIARPAAASGGGFSGTVVFGDSLSDQGNLFGATESLIGTPLSGIPRLDHYDNGRFTNDSDGINEGNWVDALAGRLGVSSEPSVCVPLLELVPERKLGFQRVAYSPAPGDRGRFHWAVCDDQGDI